MVQIPLGQSFVLKKTRCHWTMKSLIHPGRKILNLGHQKIYSSTIEDLWCSVNCVPLPWQVPPAHLSNTPSEVHGYSANREGKPFWKPGCCKQDFPPLNFVYWTHETLFCKAMRRGVSETPAMQHTPMASPEETTSTANSLKLVSGPRRQVRSLGSHSVSVFLPNFGIRSNFMQSFISFHSFPAIVFKLRFWTFELEASELWRGGELNICGWKTRWCV